MLACIPSATVLGATGLVVHVEAHVSSALPGVSLVGSPDTACREGVERLKAAFLTSEIVWPGTRKKVTINLTPPSLKKLGSGLDIAMAVAVLVAADELPPESVDGTAFLGELGLDGSLRRVPAVVPMTGAVAALEGVERIVVPAVCHHEAEVAAPGRVRSASRLVELLDALAGRGPWPDPPPAPPDDDDGPGGALGDLAQVRGQATARRALEVAAAGGHHLLMVGPPGAGKTMLAQRLPGLLPPLDQEAALEVTSIWSAAGLRLPAGGLVRRPPFRAPHHGASIASIVGGGSAFLRPGEASCAHRGVLFLDELGEFPAHALDSLRTPIEEGIVRVARARAVADLPARFQLVASTNPCPCGDDGPSCRCTPAMRARYLRRLSGPLLDRFDLRIAVARPSPEELVHGPPAEPSAAVAERVGAARELARWRGLPPNAELRSEQLEQVAIPGEEAAALLTAAVASGRLSGRGVARVRAVARTLADLEGHDAPVLTGEHIALAMAMRQPLLAADPTVQFRRPA